MRCQITLPPSAKPDIVLFMVDQLAAQWLVSQTEWITRGAEQYIATADRTKPLYAQVSYVQPHSPFQPPADRMKNVDETLIPKPAGVEWVNDQLHPRCFPQTEGATIAIPANWRAVAITTLPT